VFLTNVPVFVAASWPACALFIKRTEKFKVFCALPTHFAGDRASEVASGNFPFSFPLLPRQGLELSVRAVWMQLSRCKLLTACRA